MAESTSPQLPTEEDEKREIELQHYIDDNQFKGQPYFGERCDNCHYYLDPDNKLSYCWHPKIRILVGGAWWCQWWEEPIDDDKAESDDLTVLEPKPVDEQNTAALQKLADEVTLKAVPYDDQRCDNCHFYHMDPAKPTDAKIAYCWHEKLQVLVGAEWWCERWEELHAPEKDQ